MFSTETPKPRASNGQKRTLSRSPHPYHKQQADIIQSTNGGGRKAEAKIQVDDHRPKWSRESSSSNDSGTEADDEHGTFLRALPPAPLRLPKGLKYTGTTYQGTVSPLLTPSILDEDHRRQEWEKPFSDEKRPQGPIASEDGKRKTRAKFEAKRQAELLRRIVETFLLVVVGFVACWPFFNSIKQQSTALELLSWITIVLGLYILYPLRLLSRRRIKRSRGTRLLPWVRVSASFDPAPFLYPVLVPVFVSLALGPERRNLVLNITLCIASIPKPIVPLTKFASHDYSLQWALSLIPLILSPEFRSAGHQSQLSKQDKSFDRVFAENMSLIVPLHQTLLVALHYLTTSSLLPAEVVLLSASLINLLVLSTSPQTRILKAILWIGGSAMFVMTWRVLRWEVALARIPTWRFRNPKLRLRRDHILRSAFDDVFKGRLNRIFSGSDDARSSFSDTCEVNGGIFLDKRKTSLKKHRYSGTDGNGIIHQHSCYTDEPTRRESKKAHRRNTMPTHLETPKDFAIDLISPFSAPHTSLSRAFLRLSQTQGAIVQWLIACYTYSVVVATILIPIRLYISHHALSGYEPAGWALGYLFGSFPEIYQHADEWGLKGWIPLQMSNTDVSIFTNLSRDEVLGILKTPSPITRLSICAWCILILSLGLASVFCLSTAIEVDTRRKVFHGMMVAMFLPTIFVDPAFISLAFSLILPIFLLLDLFRASQLPPLSRPLTNFLAPYVDGRDHRGPVIVSHIFLLIGCAIPLWLSLAAIGRTGRGPWTGWDVPERKLGMVSGVICVGMGDAAASLIGRRFGRRQWCWSGGKSLEGSLAFMTAVVLGLCFARWWLQVGGWAGDSKDTWAVTLLKASVAGAGASLTEAVLTGGNDNVIVPVILWLLVQGLGV